METRYIVVVIHNGIGYTLQSNNELHVFFYRSIKEYKRVWPAIRMAGKLSKQYPTQKACVFKITQGERVSCDQYKNWYQDKERLIWES